MEVSVVVPTYQERDSILTLVERAAKALKGIDFELIIVDDDSPDGTADAAVALGQTYPVHVVCRKGVRGLGSAILEGFRNAHGDKVGVIDADLQHPPEVLPELVEALRGGADIAVASRYVTGGGVEGWSVIRKVTSRGATLLARPFTRVRDPMSGCFMITSDAIAKLNLSCEGYKLLLEILAKSKHSTVKEIPYVFRERQYGKSKLSSKEYVRYLQLLIRLGLEKSMAGDIYDSRSN